MYTLINKIDDSLIGQQITGIFHDNRDCLIYLRMGETLLCVDASFGVVECYETLSLKALERVGLITAEECIQLTQEKEERERLKKRQVLEETLVYYRQKIEEFEKELISLSL